MQKGIEEIAKIMGKSSKAVRLWIKEGCPVASAPQAGQKGYLLDTREVIEWYKKRAVATATNYGDAMTKEEAQLRKIAAEAELAELEIAKKKGEVVELAEIQRELSNRFAEIAAQLDKIPERCAMRLVGETDEIKIKDVIRGEINEVREAIADE